MILFIAPPKKIGIGTKDKYSGISSNGNDERRSMQYSHYLGRADIVLVRSFSQYSTTFPPLSSLRISRQPYLR